VQKFRQVNNDTVKLVFTQITLDNLCLIILKWQPALDTFNHMTLKRSKIHSLACCFPNVFLKLISMLVLY